MMLDMTDVAAFYGDVQVLRDFSLQVQENEILCLLGRNGAGKTTALKTIMGLVRARKGSIHLQQHALHELPAHRIPALGMGYVPQGRRLFAELSVAENLQIGLMAGSQNTEWLQRIYQRFPILQERLRQRAGTLSGGEQQMLAIARALCIDPKVLLLDEPTEGLQPSMIQTIRDVITRLRSEGVTIVIVEQRVDAVLSIADRVAFIENGQNRETVDVARLQQNPHLIDRYVGISHS